MALSPLQPVSLRHVVIDGDFWAPRLDVNRRTTVQAVYRKCAETGRIDAFRLTWRQGDPNPPHIFWDGHVAKWLEAASCILATHPDPALARQADDVANLIASAQQPDGYLNVHFTVVEPDKRWTNLRDNHELYLAGLLMEAAVAYYQATGRARLLETVCRYADYIGTVFGRGPTQKRGYPGHEEIELALVKLYRATGQKRYLDLASYFIEERGSQPHYYDQEAWARGEDPKQSRLGGRYEYNQSHVPIREQTEAIGHAVRAMYLYAGAADVATETGDTSLLDTLRRLWLSTVTRRMYVTGGLGSASQFERFTFDYDLPNDIAYAETCASIGLIFWAHRMLQMEADGAYADVLERALYNGALSGVSLEGDAFFYANPLEVFPPAYDERPDLYRKPSVMPRRQPWYHVACCPTNVVRLLASLGQYVASTAADELYLHLYVGGQIEASVTAGPMRLAVATRYPWEGQVLLKVIEAPTAPVTLALRVPGWARSHTLALNGEPLPAQTLERGYIKTTRVWLPGDTLALDLPLPVEKIEAHPSVRMNGGRLALQRGPLVYCFEEADNGPRLTDMLLPASGSWQQQWQADLLGGVVTLHGETYRRDLAGWDNVLYRPLSSQRVPQQATAIPYYAWANRTLGEMLVWVPSL